MLFQEQLPGNQGTGVTQPAASSALRWMSGQGQGQARGPDVAHGFWSLNGRPPQPEPEPVDMCTMELDRPHQGAIRGTFESPAPIDACNARISGELRRENIGHITSSQRCQLLSSGQSENSTDPQVCAEVESSDSQNSALEESIAGIAAQLEEWRKADTADKLRIHQSMRELFNMNHSTLACIRSGELAQLRGSIVKLTQSVDDFVTTQNTEDPRNLVSLGNSIVEKTTASMKAEVDMWHQYVTDKRGRWHSNDRRWRDLCETLGQIVGGLDRVESACTAHQQMDASHDELLEQSRASLCDHVSKAVVDATQEAVQRLHQDVTDKMGRQAKALRDDINDIVAGAMQNMQDVSCSRADDSLSHGRDAMTDAVKEEVRSHTYAIQEQVSKLSHNVLAEVQHVGNKLNVLCEQDAVKEEVRSHTHAIQEHVSKLAHNVLAEVQHVGNKLQKEQQLEQVVQELRVSQGASQKEAEQASHKLEKATDALRASQRASQRETQQAFQKLQEETDELSHTHVELRTARGEAEVFAAESTRSRQDVHELQAQLTSAQSEAENKILHWRGTVHRVQTAEEQMADMRRDAECEAAELRTQIHDANSEVGQLRSALAEANAESRQADSELRSLRQFRRQQRSFFEETQVWQAQATLACDELEEQRARAATAFEHELHLLQEVNDMQLRLEQAENSEEGLAHVNQQVEQAQHKLARVQVEKGELSAESVRLQSDLLARSKDAASWRKRAVEACSELEKARSEHTEASADVKYLRHEVQTLQEIHNSKAEQDALSAHAAYNRAAEDLQHSHVETDELSAQLVGLRCETLSQRDELESAQEQLELSSLELARSCSKADEFAAQLASSSAEVKYSRTEMEEMSVQLASLRHASSSHQADMRSAQEQLESSSLELADSRCKADEFATQLVSSRSEISYLQDQLDNELPAARLEAEEAVAETQRLRHAVANLADKEVAVTHELHAARSEAAEAFDKASHSKLEVAEHTNQQEASAEAARLQQEVENLNDQVLDLQDRLDEAEARSSDGISPLETIHRVDEIEQHGNMWIDLRSGDVEFKDGRTLKFPPCQVGEPPTIELLEQEVAKSLLDDISQVQLLFNVVVEIVCYAVDAVKLLPPDDCQRLAQSRAEHISDGLIDRGVEQSSILARGLPVKKSAARPPASVSICFRIFSTAEW